MKGLIWFLCIFACAAVFAAFRMKGILLGGIPSMIIFGSALWLARTLCRKWDEHKEDQERGDSNGTDRRA